MTPQIPDPRATAVAELIERLNIFASDGCSGPYEDEPCFRSRLDMPMEWCPNCAAQEAAKHLSDISAALADAKREALEEAIKAIVADRNEHQQLKLWDGMNRAMAVIETMLLPAAQENPRG
jgi:hypothetical protein